MITQKDLGRGLNDGIFSQVRNLGGAPNRRSNSIFGVTVPKINIKMLIPFLNRELSYGATQGMLLFGVG